MQRCLLSELPVLRAARPLCSRQYRHLGHTRPIVPLAVFSTSLSQVVKFQEPFLHSAGCFGGLRTFFRLTGCSPGLYSGDFSRLRAGGGSLGSSLSSRLYSYSGRDKKDDSGGMHVLSGRGVCEEGGEGEGGREN